MTDKEKYDFIDHVVHLTLLEEDRLLNEHGGEYSGLEEDGIDSNEYYRIITERVINILKKNNNYMQEEPVSEDLEEAALRANMIKKDIPKEFLSEYPYDRYGYHKFIEGANWQFNQLEKNRLKHCNSITNEQAELEQGFIDQHLDKHQRMPTFLDAIEYGMRLREEQMTAKAIDGVVTFDYYGDDDKTYGCIAQDSFCLEDFGLKDMNKVKMILIKED